MSSSVQDILSSVDKENLPRHIAIIMDGNGRWAQERGLPRIEGHRAGTKAVREVVETSGNLGIEILTLYTFSMENWQRPKEEVGFLMLLIEQTIRQEIAELHQNEIKVQVLGRLHELPASLQAELYKDMELTKNNKKMVLNLAINYGSRSEIVDAVGKLAQQVKRGLIMPEDIDEDLFQKYLYTQDMPDPDLLIRTGGEQRLSNFLLWQSAYTELYIVDIYWPDFRGVNLVEAIKEYQRRVRRFGRVIDII